MAFSNSNSSHQSFLGPRIKLRPPSSRTRHRDQRSTISNITLNLEEKASSTDHILCFAHSFLSGFLTRRENIFQDWATVALIFSATVLLSKVYPTADQRSSVRSKTHTARHQLLAPWPASYLMACSLQRLLLGSRYIISCNIETTSPQNTRKLIIFKGAELLQRWRLDKS